MPPPRRQPAGRTIPTSSGSGSAKRRSANARASRPGVDDKPLLPNQYGTNAAPANGSKAGEAPGQSTEGSAAPSTNAELGSKGFTSMFGRLWAPKEEYTPFTGEPARSSLTEPPPGYRTPSPTQPYGVGRDKWVAPSRSTRTSP